VSFFLYIYAVKIQSTILLFFIFTLSLLANPTTKKDRIKGNINSTVVSNQGADTSALTSPTISSNANGGGLTTNKGSLNSILSSSILIFFSVLIIILIDNRKLQRRYEKLASDFNSKDSIL
jgi:hypothetical protein